MTAEASSDGVLRIVSCSSLTDVKRPRLLAEIVREVGRAAVAVQWDHFGSGSLEGEVRAIASGFPSSVEWTLHGQVPNEQIIRHYESNAVDVFLNASSSEGVPVSMMEAMSAGIPIVAPSVGGIGEIVNQHNGRLVPADWGPAEVAARVIETVRVFAEAPRSLIRDRWALDFSADSNYRSFANELLDRSKVTTG